MSLIINPRNKQQEKVVRAFLSSLNIGFHSEEEEDAALVNAIKKEEKLLCSAKLKELIFLSV